MDINTGQTIKFNQNVYLATNLYFNSENALIYVSDGSGSYNSTNIIPENLNQSVIFPTSTEINVECRNKKLGVANVSIPGPQSIESLTLTNFENRGKYLLELAPVGGIILTIRGSTAGGITNAKVNFEDDITVDGGLAEIALMTILVDGQGNILVSCSKYV